MRAILASICTLAVIGTASAAEPAGEKAAVVSLVRQIMKSWNSNDTGSATAHLSPSIVITDSLPPYLFQGPTAVADWMKSFAADAEANGITDPWQTLGKPTEVEIDGPHAYAAFPAVYGFKQHGKPVRENAMVTVTLEKSEPDWRVVSWTWSKR
ncbi:MAG TPA: hypothetical protein VM689_24360 [Aliidongia sp.]|nr:hypothetical protein [Aliidongia sp.]